MFLSRRWAVIVFGAALVLPLTVRGEDRLVSKGGGRPLSELAWELQGRYGFLISYEEAPFDARRDVVHIPGPGGQHGNAVLRSVPISFDLSPIPGGRRSSAQDAAPTIDRATITSFIEQYNASGNPGRFSVIFDGEYVHIVPAGRFVDGRLAEFEPVLSSEIVLEERVAPCIDVFHELLDKVSQARGVSVQEGVIPLNSFLHGQRCVVKGGTQVARSALNQILSDVGQDSRFPPVFPLGRFSWALHYDVNMEGYFLNIRAVRTDARPPRQPAGSLVKAGESEGQHLKGIAVQEGKYSGGKNGAR